MEFDHKAEYAHKQKMRQDFYDFVLRLAPLILIGIIVL